MLTLPMPDYVDDAEMVAFHEWAWDVCGVAFKAIKDRVAATRQLALGFWWDSETLTRELEEKKLLQYAGDVRGTGQDDPPRDAELCGPHAAGDHDAAPRRRVDAGAALGDDVWPECHRDRVGSVLTSALIVLRVNLLCLALIYSSLIAFRS